MDVRCGRCGTEYEFDDALISERGTTVKCTNCGYQFKVFPDAAAAAPERWVVRTLAGRELIYTSLRELQRGISRGLVGPDDLLARGNRSPRPLSAIAELEPFLRSRQGTRQRVDRTLHGVAPAPIPSRAASDARPAAGPELPASAKPNAQREPRHTPAFDSTAPLGERPPEAPPKVAASELAPAHDAPLASNLAAPAPASATAVESVSPPTIPLQLPSNSAAPSPKPTATEPRPPELAPEFASRPGAPQEPVAAATPRETSPTSSHPHAPSGLQQARVLLQHDDQTDPHYVHSPTRRNARSRWLVFVVVLGAGVLLAATVGRRYLAQYSKPASEPTHQTDARVTPLLAEGEQLLEAGDLEGARESLAKASVLAEQDASVLSALARLEVIRADLAWLKLRLLDPDDTPSVEHTHRELGARVGKAERAVGRAKQTDPESVTTQRLIVNLARLAGKLKEARGNVSALSKESSQAENAYALAMLDLAEKEPAWSSIVHRLRTATGSRTDVGRARAALAYALVQSNQVGLAENEVEKLAKVHPSHPLLFELRGFVQRHAEDSSADGEQAASVDPSRLPELDKSPAPDTDADTKTTGDFRTQLKQAYNALEAGRLEEAERLYNAVLHKQPGNTEALAGLADVAHQKNDSARASELYEQVLDKNPSYLPALMANADQKWASGDRASALKLYRRILDQAGADSSYGRRAASRIAQAENRAEPTAPAAKAREDETGDDEPAPPKPPSETAPHIDTTDLPEFHQ